MLFLSAFKKNKLLNKQQTYFKMKKIALLFSLFMMLITPVMAQKKQISVADIYQGTFATKRMESLRSRNNGTQYTLLEKNATSGASEIGLYAYKTLEKEAVLLSSDAVADIDHFSEYTFSQDESKVLLATAVGPIFRRSTLGVYYIYDFKTKTTTPLSNDAVQEPYFSPDGSKIAYVKDNNLFVYYLATGKTVQITADGKKNFIINGVTDWVYEEEFGFVRAFDWNSDGTRIAFLRFDETKVPTYSMDVIGENLYPTQQVFKYPKAGENNAVVSLQVHHLEDRSTVEVSVPDAYYIPRLQWRNHPDLLSFQEMGRRQNKLTLYNYNAKSQTLSVLLEEKDAAYVEVTSNLTFFKDDSFVWTSEQDGYNHLYYYNKAGKLIRQLTKGNWEVTAFYGLDEKRKTLYFQGAAHGSINRDIYKVGTNGKGFTRLSQTEGTHYASFSSNFSYYINQFSNAATPPIYTLNKAYSGKVVKEVINNRELLNTLAGFETSKKEFSTINVNGNSLNMYLVKPPNFDPSKKYPLFMFQYSGPGSQSVANRWLGANDYWHMMLAAKGYIVACVDGRGTGLKGRDFKKSTYLNLVKYETEDQIAAAKILSARPYIDTNRTGIWGWSFGGHMASNAILKGNTVFEMAIAVAPVTSWRFYDTVYTERFLRTPKENPAGYDENSPFNYPELLKGKFLLVHGSGDDNVHLQNSMRFAESLIQANKDFEWAIYPDKNHGIYGGNTRIHLYNKMTKFVLENL